MYKTAVETALPKYSLVIMIHGDANYVYHDTVGIAHYADAEALAKAQTIARANPQAEVLIFHDKPLTRSLLFFKEQDGDFYLYRGGELAATESYWRDEGSSRFAAQGALYKKYRHRDPEAVQRPVSMFLYFGHEIPEMEGLHYDESYPDSTLTITKFSNDLQSFGTDESRFDIFMMSTCFNGTPRSVTSLLPHTRYLIASPTNLHLSYFDIGAFEHLEVSMNNRDVPTFTRFAAEGAFNKLSAGVQTVVAVAVYDMSIVEPYLESVNESYSKAIASIESAPTLTLAHCDCQDLSPYKSPLMSSGVEVFYRPPMFGVDATKLTHSGWECWKTQ